MIPVCLYLIGDRYRLHRILINLLSNAIKFTVQGYVKLKVNLVRKTGKFVIVRFIVEDTGIGIPKEKQEYIFEKFSRLSLSNKGFYKGIGLGLRIVKQFMHEMEGEIDLISEYEKGTQFICTISFKLPLSDDFVES
ncbi:ATP-binding protein [Coxiella endosymbiont of Ornithodoros maritimus]|uniref:ATP-binding protein n=1 Tax=Coxiella endosymbiont of Ornithodoros maritimus TaxID=1656172 RepID=UPI002263DE26|nr:ATP-binding protein [Coxiella endosymbiont of Ornithodoros maritimus]